MIVPVYPGHIVPLKIFMALKLDLGFFGGLKFGPGIFLGIEFCLHSIIPAT